MGKAGRTSACARRAVGKAKGAFLIVDAPANCRDLDGCDLTTDRATFEEGFRRHTPAEAGDDRVAQPRLRKLRYV